MLFSTSLLHFHGNFLAIQFVTNTIVPRITALFVVLVECIEWYKIMKQATVNSLFPLGCGSYFKKSLICSTMLKLDTLKHRVGLPPHWTHCSHHFLNTLNKFETRLTFCALLSILRAVSTCDTDTCDTHMIHLQAQGILTQQFTFKQVWNVFNG